MNNVEGKEQHKVASVRAPVQRAVGQPNHESSSSFFQFSKSSTGLAEKGFECDEVDHSVCEAAQRQSRPDMASSTQRPAQQSSLKNELVALRSNDLFDSVGELTVNLRDVSFFATTIQSELLCSDNTRSVYHPGYANDGLPRWPHSRRAHRGNVNPNILSPLNRSAA